MEIGKKVLMLVSVIIIGFAMSTTSIYAGDVSVSGFADLVYTITDEKIPVDPNNERAFTIDGEVDFMADRGPVSVRLDLDINKGAPTAETPLTVEQVFFSLPVGMVTVTGGKFNTLIGFEGPDAPGLLQTSYGQLGGPLGTAGALGLTGVMVTGKMGMAEVDVFVKQTKGDFGAQVRLAPFEGVGLSVGYVQTADVVGVDALDILDVIATWKGDTAVGALLVAGEYVDDDELSGWGIWVNTTQGPYGLTLRYDSLDCDLAGPNCLVVPVTSTTMTVAGSYAVNDNLSTILEWYTLDPNDSVAGDDTDLVTLEAIVTF
ncbi:MAG: hypothetical protein ABGX83_10660 [Nitrospira sp.]|nr:hypothetical protein [Candidatus Manganitrophaceae bacterium]HIL35092.1 hypothetical protein [Candidatus Manganitrophaceae bacterium]